jgi:hypothetical protein
MLAEHELRRVGDDVNVKVLCILERAEEGPGHAHVVVRPAGKQRQQ